MRASVCAAVLAAGDSTRMGRPKALLSSPNGQPFVVRICSALLGAGVERVAVVTGAAHDAIAAAIADAFPSRGPTVVRNLQPARGQLSSLWTAMDAVVTDETDALLVTLVDVPMVDAATVAAVIGAWQPDRPPIVRPAIGDRHGHPVLFDRALFPELRTAPLDVGAKSVVRKYESTIRHVMPAEQGCLVDIDTPGDYRLLLGQDRDG
jgi:molybdenum cofactor cytidylyltransferase